MLYLALINVRYSANCVKLCAAICFRGCTRHFKMKTWHVKYYNIPTNLITSHTIQVDTSLVYGLNTLTLNKILSFPLGLNQFITVVQ